MNNIMQMISMLKGGKSPQETVLNMVSNSNNPMLKNLADMARNGDKEGIENFARNLYKEQGRNFDEEFNEFMKNFK